MLTRRDAIKSGAGLVLGATVTRAAGETAAAESLPALAFADVLAWEDEREAAEERGEAWVADAGSLAVVLEVATTQADRAGVPALVMRLTPLRDQAAEEHEYRRSTFKSWGVTAWELKPTNPLPPLPAEPWKG